MADTLFLSEFRQACGGGGCPFCNLAQARTRRYIGGLLYEYATAPDIHRRLAQSRGLCNPHAWLLQSVAQAEEKDGMGVAILYASVVSQMISDLEELGDLRTPGARAARGRRPSGAAVTERMRAQGPCLVCEQQLEGERYTFRQFLDELDEVGADSPLIQAYRGSAGACLPHFRALMDGRPAEPVVEWLVADQTRRLNELSEQLDTYILKHEVQHKGEPMGVERDSWIRVIEQCVGKRDVPARMAEARCAER
jgi:hypothetical protein